MAHVTSETIDLAEATLNTLTRYQGGPAVTLYMPVQTPSAKASGKQENMIRLKNLLKKLEEQVDGYVSGLPTDHGGDRKQLEALLQPLHDAVEGGDRFWDPEASGMALFLAPEVNEIIPLPIAVEELAIIDDQFHLKPLFRAKTISSPFYLLSLDMHNLALYRGTASGLQEVPFSRGAPELPELLAEFSFERTLNKAPGSGSIYVGHAGGEENLTPHILEFIDRADESVRETIGESALPVLLAGTENVVGHYRHRSHIKALLEPYVHGSPSSLSKRDLHAKAWKIISEIQANKVAQEVEAVAGALESDQGAREIGDILRAAYEGRMQILLIAGDTEVRGLFDPEAETLDITEEGTDLLEVAAQYAWTRGTRVYSLPQNEIPGNRVAAGVIHA